ncbi:MAG: BlaI/MecI/CopY family transcriptional regulator [bacterium]
MALRKYHFTFDPNKKGLRKILGDLETDIMTLIWKKGALTVRQVYDQLQEERDMAYTTVMTVMSRLADKGLLEKLKVGAAFVYRPTTSREEFTQSTVKKVVNELLQDFAAPTMSLFLDSMEKVDPDKMEELAKLIDEKRKKKDV